MQFSFDWKSSHCGCFPLYLEVPGWQVAPLLLGSFNCHHLSRSSRRVELASKPVFEMNCSPEALSHHFDIWWEFFMLHTCASHIHALFSDIHCLPVTLTTGYFKPVKCDIRHTQSLKLTSPPYFVCVDVVTRRVKKQFFPISFCNGLVMIFSIKLENTLTINAWWLNVHLNSLNEHFLDYIVICLLLVSIVSHYFWL